MASKNTTDRVIGDLYTGDAAVDDKLRKAFQRGIAHGEDADRLDIQRGTQIETTQRILATLMRTQNVELETVMAWLCLPKKEREIYRAIFNSRKKQQKQAKK